METIIALGAWNWMILAAILFVLELLAPGIFLMWFGVAAAATALIVFRYDFAWQWQLIWFCGLSLASVLLAAKYLRKHPLESERPLLNERAVQLDRSFLRADRPDRQRKRQHQDGRHDLAGGRSGVAQGCAHQSGRRRRHGAQGRAGRCRLPRPRDGRLKPRSP